METTLIAFCDTCDNGAFTLAYSNMAIEDIASDICDNIPLDDEVEASIETEDGEVVAWINGNCDYWEIMYMKELPK